MSFNNELFVNILQKKRNDGILILDFTIANEQFEPITVIHDQLKGEYNKLVKYLVKNYHVGKLLDPRHTHIYQIIYKIVKRYPLYYSWLKHIDLKKVNESLKRFKEVYLFIPRRGEICNRVINFYNNNTAFDQFYDKIKDIAAFLVTDPEDDIIKERVDIILRGIFKQSERLLAKDRLIKDNPCLCHEKKGDNYVCYLRQSDKQFSIICENNRNEQFFNLPYLLSVDKSCIQYNSYLIETMKVIELGVEQFYSALFINNYLQKVWNRNRVQKQLSAFVCGNRGEIVYKSTHGSLSNLFYRKENRNNAKLMVSTLLQLYGSLLELQEEEYFLLHKQLGGNSVVVNREDQLREIEYLVNIDAELFESITREFEDTQLAQLEARFTKWFNEKYELDIDDNSNHNNSNHNNSNLELNTDVDEDEDENDNNDDDENDDDENNDDENDEEELVGGDPNNEDRDEDDENENNDNQNEEEDYDQLRMKVFVKHGLSVRIGNFSKAALSFEITDDTTLRLYASRGVGEQIDTDRYDRFLDYAAVYKTSEMDPKLPWFYMSYDGYYFLISFLLEPSNTNLFKNKSLNWIWKSIWCTQEEADHCMKLIISKQGDKDKHAATLAILSECKLRNDLNWSIFLRLHFLQQSNLI